MGAVRVALLSCIAIALAAPAANADTSRSPNWAGYVVHRNRVAFSEVSAEWVEPAATCIPGRLTRSSIWIGLGGNAPGARGLEQIGTSANCTPSGSARSGAWYELVPALSRGIDRRVSTGDLLRADVRVNGGRVRMSLTDFTSGWTYIKRVRPASIDTSSAEWIVESPANCLAGPSCHPFALTNFGSVIFAQGRARSSRGHAGPIADPHWQATRVLLHRRVSSPGTTPAPQSVIAATPGPLLTTGTDFTVTYGT